ncbi:hypothetical protein [Gordonia aquimaris]|uniref:Uncharacterized protein n=1 Tax=Gordonia aquimaris TaxID=2984863 RepID=A0A9X3I6J7_9ACTN|nr:hypothetical protein [Gordonia aquimaris]MCX2965594.1 hypothetical protein [Gordonia aquimaris]
MTTITHTEQQTGNPAFASGYRRATNDLAALDLEPKTQREVARIIARQIPFGGPDHRWGYRSALVDLVNREHTVSAVNR